LTAENGAPSYTIRDFLHSRANTRDQNKIVTAPREAVGINGADSSGGASDQYG
jgi:hypothetical protein